MKYTINDTLLEILKIINYSNNKQEYIKKFEELNKAEALLYLLNKLPKNIQGKIKISKNQAEDIKKYISKKEFISELTKVSQAAIIKIVKDMILTLSKDQKMRIAKLVK